MSSRYHSKPLADPSKHGASLLVQIGIHVVTKAMTVVFGSGVGGSSGGMGGSGGVGSGDER